MGTKIVKAFGTEAVNVPLHAMNIKHRELQPHDIEMEMLDFCARHNIKADIELINIQQVNEAFNRLQKGDVKYRFVIDMASLKI
jgi:alcohol dehydrogenase (NADP+)